MANTPTNNDAKAPTNADAAKAAEASKETAPSTSDTAGTSRQPNNPAQDRNTILNPAAESAEGAPVAAPGVTPTNRTDKEPASTEDAVELSQASEFPEPSTQLPGQEAEIRWYTVLSGKHSYVDPETGEKVVAKTGERAPLTRKQFDTLRGRFADDGRKNR